MISLKSSITLKIYIANSREGASMSATTSCLSGAALPPLFMISLSFNSYSTIGTVKANVFPEPVQALTQTSLFDKKRGITVFYTLETLSKLNLVLI
jgi:hypothetical protein